MSQQGDNIWETTRAYMPQANIDVARERLSGPMKAVNQTLSKIDQHNEKIDTLLDDIAVDIDELKKLAARG